MQPQAYKVASEILWQTALILAVIDIPFAAIFVTRVNREMFVQLRSALTITSAAFWFFIQILMFLFFWQEVYHFVFPEQARQLIPPVYGLLFGLVALLFWQLSFRLPGRPVLNFCVLGGLWGMLTHLWASAAV